MNHQIYFYSTHAQYEDQVALGRAPMLKIGDTNQHSVDTRIEQQDGTSCAQPLERKAAFYTTHTDKQFHRYLLNNGFRKTRDDKDREWFFITVEEATTQLQRFENKELNPIERYFTPRYHQLQVVNQVLERWNGSTMVQPLDLCARFGKTLFNLHLFHELGWRNIIIASYYLTANESFKSEVRKNFDITHDIEVINPTAEEYHAVPDNKRRLIDVSLYADTLDEQLLHALQSENNLIVVDEADYGAWCTSQREKLQRYAEAGNNLVILTTGTNMERALIGCVQAQPPISVSYLQLVEGKRYGLQGYESIVEVSTLALQARTSWSDEENSKSQEARVNISKMFSKANSHITREVLNQLFSMDSPTNLLTTYESIAEVEGVEKPVIMLFISGTKSDVQNTVQCGRTILPEYDWLALTGDTTCNREAEALTNDALEAMHNKHALVVVSRGMGSRSYSIPNCTTVVLAKDGGSTATAVQQASRALTPHDGKRTGLVVEYGFDTERITGIESELIGSLVQNDTSTDTDAVMRRVYKLMNVLRMDEFGYPVHLSESDFLKFITTPQNIVDLATATVDYDALLELDNIEALLFHAKCVQGKKTLQLQKVLEHAKTYITRKREQGEPVESDAAPVRDVVRKIRAVVETVGNLHELSPYSTSFTDALHTVSNNKVKSDEYFNLVGIEPEHVMQYLLPSLPVRFMDMIILRTIETQDTSHFATPNGDDNLVMNFLSCTSMGL